MRNKYIIFIVIILIAIIAILVNSSSKSKIDDGTIVKDDSTKGKITIVTEEGGVVKEIEATTEKDKKVVTVEASVKEFEMNSFHEIVDGDFFPEFSVKEITVNKGDIVRIKVNAINGAHDFKLDEFNAFAETPAGEVTVIEFTADQVGEFIYYCNKPGHRAAGQWGTIKVLE